MSQFIHLQIGQRVLSTQKGPFHVLLMARIPLKVEVKAQWIQVREKWSPHPSPRANSLTWGESITNPEDFNMSSKWTSTHKHHTQTYSGVHR